MRTYTAFSSATRVQTDERTRRYISALERAVSRHLGGKKKIEGAYEAANVPDARPPGELDTERGAEIRGCRVRVDGKAFGFCNGFYLSGNPTTEAAINLIETAHRTHLASAIPDNTHVPFGASDGYSECLVGAYQIAFGLPPP